MRRSAEIHGLGGRYTDRFPNLAVGKRLEPGPVEAANQPRAMIRGVSERRSTMKPERSSKWIFAFLMITLVATMAVPAQATTQSTLATEYITPNEISWQPLGSVEGFVLTVSRPDGQVIQKEFEGAHPSFSLFDDGGPAPDGQYNYELQAIPILDPEVRDAMRAARNSGDLSTLEKLQKEHLPKTLVQSGSFRVSGGALVLPTEAEELPLAMGTASSPDPTQDILHYDDVIITGSLCVGFDCADGESFGFDTGIFKEHNLRLYFNDTSYTASYPTNSWRITINDSTNGGASYFSIDDVDDGTSIFKIEAGAPSNSLYVEDYGRVGLGTSTPVVEMHIKDSDTPTVRLEQDSSGGWTAQTFDVGSNESNFFIRDATNGSKLPFRIQPSTPSSTLCLKSDGRVGVGTWSPGYAMELEKTGENAAFVAERTDGATNYINATASFGNFGTVTSHPLRLVAGGLWKMKINTDGTLEMSDGGSYNGTWNNASSRKYKENIESLETRKAFEAVKELRPVRYHYKSQQDERLGFIAEEVPDLVAMDDRKSLSTMDIVAALTKVVQEQMNVMEAQQRVIDGQQKALQELLDRMDQFEAKWLISLSAGAGEH
jgi:hypothetical protein